MPALGENPNRRLSQPASFIALGFGAGLSPVAPGTAGTLLAWLIYSVLLARLPDKLMALLLVASLVVGWWACRQAARKLADEDPSAIVWDEMIAFWLVLWLIAPADIWLQVWAFALFRFFDAVKPPPVRWADRAFKGPGWRGAWGILWDDLVAAFCTLIVIAIGVRFF